MALPVFYLCDGDLVKRVRTPPVRQRTGGWGVYMSLSSRREIVVVWGNAGEDNVCGAHSRSVKCIAPLSSTGPR